MSIVPLPELQRRMAAFQTMMDTRCPQWELAFIISKVNLYYFTGTMQDGLLAIRRGGEPQFFIRRSLERAQAESLFLPLLPMASYRDAAAALVQKPDTVYLEAEIVPLAMVQRMQKAFGFQHTKPLDNVISAVRSIKSLYELALMEQAGEIHRRVLEERVPGMLREGMSEAELATSLYAVLVEEGHHGVARFGMFDTEIAVGQIAFGDNSLYPAYFNGPGGSVGLDAAAPVLGSRERKLRRGDLVFVDIGCGVQGYHTDKTMTYQFGCPLPTHAIDAHRRCVEIQNEIASMLLPGKAPADIYRQIIGSLKEEFLQNFMGYGSRRVKFLGHGVGLLIDELPVIAEGFNEPMCEGMAFAVEPKKGITGVGMVGTENTYFVTPSGGHNVTGVSSGLIEVF